MSTLTVSASSALDVTTGTDRFWSNVSNVLSSNDSHSECESLVFGQVSNILLARFDLSALPASITVDGLEALIEHKKSAGDSCLIDTVQFWNGSTESDGIGDDKATGILTTSDVIDTYGTNTDKWSITPTRALITGANFGLGLQYQHGGGKMGVSALVDHTRLRVTYTEVATGLSVAKRSTALYLK